MLLKFFVLILVAYLVTEIIMALVCCTYNFFQFSEHIVTTTILASILS